MFFVYCLIRILYQMYINREQNDHWNHFYHTIAWACVYLFMDAIWIMNVKHLLRVCQEKCVSNLKITKK